jgi:hypothetical protein
MIYEVTIVNTGSKDRKTNMEIKKPYAVVQYNKFMKGVDWADQYKNFLHKVGRSWISEVQNQSESSSGDLQLPEEQTTPRGPKQDLPGRLSRDFRIHNNGKMFAGGREKRSILQDSVKCVPHIRSEVKLDTYINPVVPFHNGSSFEKYHSVMNYLDILHAFDVCSTCSICSFGLRSVIYNVKL